VRIAPTAGRVPPVGAILTWDGLTFTVRAGDERRVTRIEIARRRDAPEAHGPEDGAERRARATARS
jgi:CBS domain containing-hemolysin-like protein